jgi:hypothetical protein
LSEREADLIVQSAAFVIGEIKKTK